MDKKISRLPALSAAALLAAVAVSSVQAATVTFEYNQSFGAVAPDGPTPWATAVFDDGGTAGNVTLTMTASSNIGVADITSMYFNLADDSQVRLDMLTFTYSSGPEANSVDKATDGHRPGGDGFYDIHVDFPPPGGQANFPAGAVSVYNIIDSGGILVAGDFNVFATPGPGNTSGPFLSVARFQSTGGGEGSDWVGAVPIPAAVWLFGSGLLGLVGIARRRRS